MTHGKRQGPIQETEEDQKQTGSLKAGESQVNHTSNSGSKNGGAGMSRVSRSRGQAKRDRRLRSRVDGGDLRRLITAVDYLCRVGIHSGSFELWCRAARDRVILVICLEERAVERI